MKNTSLLLPPKIKKDTNLTVRLPRPVRVMANQMAEAQSTSLSNVVEAGIKLLFEKVKDEKKKS